MRRWYAAQTKNNEEKTAVEHLLRQGFSVLCLMYARRVRVRGEVEEVPRPLIPGYIFVQMDLDEPGWQAVGNTRGVTRVLSFGTEEGPCPIPEEQMSSLISNFGNGAVRDLATGVSMFKTGMRLKITDGPLAGFIGDCVWSTEQRVKLLLWCLGRRQAVTFSPSSLELAA